MNVSSRCPPAPRYVILTSLSLFAGIFRESISALKRSVSIFLAKSCFGIVQLQNEPLEKFGRTAYARLRQVQHKSCKNMRSTQPAIWEC